MSFGQPAPRPVLDKIHELDPVAESIIAVKQNLNNFKTIGPNAAQGTVPAGGVNIDASKAIVMALKQIGIPHDHPNFPPIMKLPTAFQSNEYVVLWGAAGKVKWTKDDSFWHIPGYSRYVINATGQIKNAFNGMVVNENGFAGSTELVCDGPLNSVSWTNANQLKMLTLAKLPDDFKDYGFRNYNYEMAFKDDAIRWVKKTEVIAKSTVDGLERTIANITEFIDCYVKDFQEKGSVRKQIKEFSHANPIRTQEFVVRLAGDVPAQPASETPIAAQAPNAELAPAQPTTPVEQAPAPAAQPAPAAPAPGSIDFDDDVAF